MPSRSKTRRSSSSPTWTASSSTPTGPTPSRRPTPSRSTTCSTPRKRDLLRAAFTDPERLKPKKTRDALTDEAAANFSTLAHRLRDRGHAPETVAHFVNRLVFCMFAEDVGLLPDRLFQRMLEASRPTPADFAAHAATLFAAMQAGGLVGFTPVDWFNGGLFDDDTALPVDRADIDQLLDAARLDWSQIDPSILGTLFERGLDPGKRSQLGAHYTDRDKIMKIVNPVIVDPLLAEWADGAGRDRGRPRPREGRRIPRRRHPRPQPGARAAHRLPRAPARPSACSTPPAAPATSSTSPCARSRTSSTASTSSARPSACPAASPQVGPEAVRGIELNPYAAELARVSVWIGEIQWMRATASTPPATRSCAPSTPSNAATPS